MGSGTCIGHIHLASFLVCESETLLVFLVCLSNNTKVKTEVQLVFVYKEKLKISDLKHRISPFWAKLEPFGAKTEQAHTQAVHECHPTLASLTESWVQDPYIPFLQLARPASVNKGHPSLKVKSTGTKWEKGH